VKNVIYLVLDALRPDRMGCMGHEPSPSPFLDSVSESSILCTNAFTVGNPTEFALPGLLSSSRVLDYGGYSNGISDVPISLAEVFRENGYATTFVSGLYERSSGSYSRGFDNKFHIYDYNKIPVDIQNTLPHYKELLRTKSLSKDECYERLRGYFEVWFNDVINHSQQIQEMLNEKRIPDSRIFNNYNFDEIIRQVEKEYSIYKKDPIKYICNILGGTSFGLVEIVNNFVSDRMNRAPFDWSEIKFRYAFLRYLIHSFVFSTSYKSAKEAVALGLFRAKDGLQRWVKYPSAGYHFETFKKWMNNHDMNTPFFAYIQAIDIHESNIFSFDLVNNKEMKNQETEIAHKCMKAIARKRKLKHGNIFYDAGIRYMDYQVEKLYKYLKDKGILDNTIIVITADHAHKSPNIPVRDINFGASFFDELFRIPIIFDHTNFESNRYNGFVSSIDIAPTVLKFAGFDIPNTFRGKVIEFDNPEQQIHVQMENQGMGPYDPIYKDTNICVRTSKYKIVYVSPSPSKSKPSYLKEIYDLVDDPNEYINLVDEIEFNEEINNSINIAKARISDIRKQS
jgi:hypothetical protein